MKITKSRLRAIIKSILLEAPLADLDEPYDARKPGEKPEVDQSLRVFKSKSFKDRMTKLLSKFPQDIWVSPVVEKDFAGKIIDDRFFIGTPDELLDLGYDKDSYVWKIVEAWLERSGGNGSLFIPFSAGVNSGSELTPWMMLHSLFDARISYTEEPFPGLETAVRIRDEVSEAVTLLDEISKSFGDVFRNHDASLPPREGNESLYNENELIEDIFTFGSARSGYFGKARRFYGGLIEYSDVANEAAVQSILSSGFKYNREGFENFKNSCLNKASGTIELFKTTVKKLKDAEIRLQKAEILSKRSHQEFIQGINGKVIIVYVSLR